MYCHWIVESLTWITNISQKQKMKLTKKMVQYSWPYHLLTKREDEKFFPCSNAFISKETFKKEIHYFWNDYILSYNDYSLSNTMIRFHTRIDNVG